MDFATQFIADIGGVDVILLCVCGLIAIFAYSTNYWNISVVLCIEFCLLIGFETYLTAIPLDDDPVIALTQELQLYEPKIWIQFIATFAYIRLGSIALTGISLGIIGYLTYIILLNLYAISNGIYVPGEIPPNYEIVMGLLCLAQLIVAMFGVLDGYRLLDGSRAMLNHIRHSIVDFVVGRNHHGV
jgi:hypothetical protein